jgi:hypothetical protein
MVAQCTWQEYHFVGEFYAMFHKNFEWCHLIEVPLEN